MKYEPPKPVELTAKEAELYSRICGNPDHDEWHEVADAMESLFESLCKRKGIPEVRLRTFFDPAYAEIGTKSRQEVFESNGTSGSEIYRHPHFVPYLRYFIDGPDLPKPSTEGLCRILSDDAGTTGMVMNQYRKHARSCVRQYGLDRGRAATEFFRLGIEIGMTLHAARALRDAAKSAR